jgi:NAD(P)-dependent dehydrogenase (short-subunit alcohol dehydrogenase family)
MTDRLKGKVAIIVGGGQSPGETIGNGRATAVLFAREGARVLVVDHNLASAQETVRLIMDEGGEAVAFRADVTDEQDLIDMSKACVDRWGRIDILHNNVGVSLAGGDAPIVDITSEAFSRVIDINLKGMVLTCKHVLPVMREQRSGSIISISSLGAVIKYPYVAYTTSKAGVISLARYLAIENAEYGVRSNVILPGLMNTPMAIETRADKGGRTREEVIAERDARVPLQGKMGSAWDVAHAALFLASDDAGFITGVSLPVDGGHALNVG